MEVARLFILSLLHVGLVWSLQTFQRCGEEISIGEGLIQSPNYPGNYPRNLECTWILVAPSGMGYSLEVEDINNRELFNGGESSCTDTLNILEVYSDSTTRYIGRHLCGSSKADLAITSFQVPAKSDKAARIEIRFESDYSEQFPGFSIKFKALCDKILSGDSGTFFSPGHPGYYIPYLKCVTTIKTPPGSIADVTFDSFDVEDSPLCLKDYVDIEIGSSSLSRSNNRYCGSTPPEIHKTTSTTVTITFVTDQEGNKKGFSGTWKSVYYPTPMSADYTGRCSTTAGGLKCQRWDTHEPHQRLHTPLDPNHNFCRNPDNDVRAPWCYTESAEIRWQYCDISTCIEDPLPTTTAVKETTIVTTPLATTIQEALNTTIEVTTTAPTEALLGPYIEPTSSAETTTAAVIIAHVSEDPLADKQTGDQVESGFPWFIILIIVVAFLILVVIILLLVRRRKRKQRLHGVNDVPPVVFTQIPEERPRENTYVEIPFLSANQPSASSNPGTLQRDNDDLKKSANGYVGMDDDTSSHGSADSIVEAKLKAYKEDKERQDAIKTGIAASDTATECPYSMADDHTSKKKGMENAYEAAGDIQHQPVKENTYETLDNRTQNAPEPPPLSEMKKESSKKKKRGLRKFFSRKSGSEEKVEAGFANPFFEEETRQQKAASSSPNPAESSDNPFSSDDEQKEQPTENAKYSKVSPCNERKQMTPPLPEKNPRLQEVSSNETYDTPGAPVSNLYQSPSTISPRSSTKEEAPRSEAPTFPHDLKIESMYDTPHAKPSRASSGNSSEMVAMSPEIIDQEHNMGGRPKQKSSPIFERAFEEHLYKSPNSLKKKNSHSNTSSPSSSPSSSNDQRKRGSSRSELDFENEEQKGGYCVMTSVPARKKRGSPQLNGSTSAPSSDSKNKKRESGMYVAMASPGVEPKL